MKSVRKAAVLLSGTGVYDGSEVFESTSILMNLHKHNYEFQCFSLNQNMTQVVNHLTSDEQKEERNILVESNRIARGQCIDIKKLKVDEFDCLVLPGGFGAAKNFSDFGFKGKDMKVNQDIERVLKEFKNSNKAIAGCCISPIILSKVFGNIKITLGKKGDDFPYSDSIDVAKSFGSQLVECDIDEICLDQDNKIITTPAFMKDTKNWNNVYDGIDKMISELEKIIQQFIIYILRKFFSINFFFVFFKIAQK